MTVKLDYAGSFFLPRTVGNESTAYGPAAFTLKKTATGYNFFSDTFIFSPTIYEGTIPTLKKAPPYNVARVVKVHKDIYGGKRPVSPEGTVTTGLYYRYKKLHWVYGQKYWNGPSLTPSYGFTDMESPYTVSGPKTTSNTQLYRRGGMIFSLAHGLLLGFGGYYSIFAGGSYGPALITKTKRLLGFPRATPCPRPANYYHSVNNTWVGNNPVDGKGTWNASDEIGGEDLAGGAAWIETPYVKAVIFFASLGTGRIAYEDGGVKCEGREDWIYQYDPHEIAAVAGNELKPWQPKPTFARYVNQAPGLTGRAAGCAFDPVTSMLYVNHAAAYEFEGERYPAVSVYRVS